MLPITLRPVVAALAVATVLAAPAPAVAQDPAKVTTITKSLTAWTVRTADRDLQPEGQEIRVADRPERDGGLLFTVLGADVRVVAAGDCFVMSSTQVSCAPDAQNDAALDGAAGAGDDIVRMDIAGEKMPATSIQVAGGPGRDSIVGSKFPEV